MSDEDILSAIRDYPSHFVVLTGGEPTLQVDEAFVDLLHQQGYEVAMESNGTRPAPQNLDWLTVSPKITRAWREAVGEKEEARAETGEEGSAWRVPDEIKIVFDEHTDPESILSTLNAQFPTLNAQLYLQPCDTGHPERNKAIADACIRYIKEHPEWRLSLQTHKLIGFK
jgi:organic radical activating enzyme